MAILYVNSQSGNNSNSGASMALAKLTLAGANSAASAGDTIYCQGRFLETIPVSKQLYWIGLGYCEFNGNGTAGVAPITGTSYRNITFTGFSDRAITPAYNTTISFVDCIFRDMPRGLRLYESENWTILRCRFYNLSIYGIEFTAAIGSGTGLTQILNCAFYGNGTDIYGCNSFAGGQAYIYYNTFGSPIMISHNAANNGYVGGMDWNVYDFANGKNVYNSVNKTTLAAWQASIAAPRDINSIDRVWRADVGDYANRSLRPNPASYLLTAGPGGTPLGIPKPALTVSNNTNSSLWTGGVFTNTELDGSGYAILSVGQTVGTVATKVIDAGASINASAVELGVAGEDATHSIDTDTGDSPNYYNVEIRASNSVFVDSAVSPSWVTLPRGGDIGSSLSGAYRYWQIRVTLRG